MTSRAEESKRQCMKQTDSTWQHVCTLITNGSWRASFLPHLNVIRAISDLEWTRTARWNLLVIFLWFGRMLFRIRSQNSSRFWRAKDRQKRRGKWTAYLAGPRTVYVVLQWISKHVSFLRRCSPHNYWLNQTTNISPSVSWFVGGCFCSCLCANQPHWYSLYGWNQTR